MPAIPANDSTGQNGVKTLADILYAQGSLKTEVAEQIKLAEIQTGKSQEEIIKGQNLASDVAITKAKAEL